MKKKPTPPATESPNLVPIMNLVVCLIPLVLAGAALVKVGVVNVTAEKFGPVIDAPEPTEEPLQLALAVGVDGFYIKAARDLSPALGSPDLTIPCRGDAYDHVALYNALTAVKSEHPNETVIKLSADPGIPYGQLVAVMDVIRFRLDADSITDLADLQAADVRVMDGHPELLWHDVVFAVAM